MVPDKFLSEDVRLHGPHSTKVRCGCDDRNMPVQDARKAITDRTDDGLAGANVLIHAVFGVEHMFDLVDWDSDGYPVTSIRARDGGSEVDVVVSQPSFEGFDCRGIRGNELVNFHFREVVSVSGRSRHVRKCWV